LPRRIGKSILSPTNPHGSYGAQQLLGPVSTVSEAVDAVPAAADTIKEIEPGTGRIEDRQTTRRSGSCRAPLPVL
jgi:hypothetical protein